MIITGVVAFAVGLIQFFLQIRISKTVLSAEKKSLLIYIPLKLAVYLAGVLLLVLCFREYVVGAAIGFGSGFFGSLAIYYAVMLVREAHRAKGGVADGNQSNN